TAAVAEARQLRMRDGFAEDAVRLTGNRANEIKIVNRMVRHPEPRGTLHERPVVPRLIDHDADVDIDERAQRAGTQEITQGEHVGTEPELEIDRRDEAAIAGDLPDAPRLREVAAHWLLHQDARSLRHLPEDVHNLIPRHGEVVDDAVERARVVQRVKHALDVEHRGGLARRRTVDIVHAGHRRPETPGYRAGHASY